MSYCICVYVSGWVDGWSVSAVHRLSRTVVKGGWKEGEDKDEMCLFVTVMCVLTQSASSVGCTVGVVCCLWIEWGSLLFVDRVG